jgi:hypothetical protein
MLDLPASLRGNDNETDQHHHIKSPLRINCNRVFVLDVKDATITLCMVKTLLLHFACRALQLGTILVLLVTFEYHVILISCDKHINISLISCNNLTSIKNNSAYVSGKLNQSAFNSFRCVWPCVNFFRAWVYLVNFICVYLLDHEFFRMWIYLLFIQLNKFSEYNRKNFLFCIIKYFNMYIFFNL